MPEYRVTYEIDVDAESPMDAAWKAYGYMISPDALPPVLAVCERGKRDCQPELIDLADANSDDGESASIEAATAEAGQ